jgi:8-oxo-dGTP pyrophosphatase MutT (NUDIX family)
MGSRYGLLLASGARRYCRAAIRVALVLSLSPYFFAVIRSFLLVFLIPHQREWWCTGPREEEGLVGWESFRWARRHTRALYADNVRQNAFSCRYVGKDFFLRSFSTFNNFPLDIDAKRHSY